MVIKAIIIDKKFVYIINHNKRKIRLNDFLKVGL